MNRVAPLLLAAATLPVLLSGCGLQPLYGGGRSGPVRTLMSQVEVAPIQGQTGWLMTNALNDRLQSNDGSAKRYRLEIKLQEQINGLGARRDDSVVRERESLRARYQLIELDKGTVVLDATAGSDAGIDVVGSEYATIAAEKTQMERLTQTVADQIVDRVARFARAGTLPK